MFGYVRPCAGRFQEGELAGYKAAYCGLCRTMGLRHGFLARFSLNYDFTFLVMILGGGTPKCAPCRRCPAHPFQPRPMCENSPQLEAAADESVILTYHKLRDDILDNGLLRALPARMAALALRRAYRRAAAARPQFDRTVRQCLDELHRLEGERSPSLDRTADTFARILQAAALPSGDAARDRALEQLLYHVGRWIYLVDAWDDLAQDKAAGAYNPIDARFDGRGEEHGEDLRLTLRHSRNLAASAYALAGVPQWDGILCNIIYLGLPMVERLVFSGEWKKARKTFRRINQ